jgi:glutamine synthetase
MEHLGSAHGLGTGQPAGGRLTLAQLAEGVEDGGIDTVVCCMTDMQGRLIGKRHTARYFLETVGTPPRQCDYLLATDMDMNLVPGYAAASWAKGYGDFCLMPDLGTLRRVPWLPGTAIVLADVLDPAGAPVPHSPRQMLKRQLERLAAAGFEADMAGEYEFYLFDQSYADARAGDYRGLKPSSWYPEDGHVFQTTKDEPFIRAVRNLMEQADIPIQGSVAEWGPGQQEINLRHAPALEMADRLMLFKNGCKEIAHLMGKAVTFMAKVDREIAGSSCHIHLSLRERGTGRAVFPDPAGRGGMSPLFEQFLAGAVRHAAAAMPFWAPNVNSYRRFRSGSFAPTGFAWSRDNRTAGFRVLGSGPAFRFECRLPGADANPYLAFAALIAGGLAGIEESLALGPAHEGDAYAAGGTMPGSLGEAVGALESSEAFARAFGPAVVAHYARYARWELSEFDAIVTEWERIRLFERG